MPFSTDPIARGHRFAILNRRVCRDTPQGSADSRDDRPDMRSSSSFAGIISRGGILIRETLAGIIT